MATTNDTHLGVCDVAPPPPSSTDLTDLQCFRLMRLIPASRSWELALDEECNEFMRFIPTDHPQQERVRCRLAYARVFARAWAEPAFRCQTMYMMIGYDTATLMVTRMFMRYLHGTWYGLGREEDIRRAVAWIVQEEQLRAQHAQRLKSRLAELTTTSSQTNTESLSGRHGWQNEQEGQDEQEDLEKCVGRQRKRPRRFVDCVFPAYYPATPP